MQFSDPIAFYFLLLIPLLLVASIFAARKRSEGWKKLIGPRLRRSLVREGAKIRRWLAFSFGLIALALLIFALTTPHAGYREEKELVRGRNLLIAIDVSRSMLAKDESPDRLTAARAAALEILELFPSDRIGIIAFSGGPWLHAPLTIDHSALAETLLQLDAETLPRGGSDLSRAVKLAVDTFKETGQPDNALIILSDGEAHDGDAKRAAEQAADANLTIFTIGFGSEEGDFIPDPDPNNDRLRDQKGNLVFTRLKSEDLRLLAEKTGGFYTQGSGKQLSRSLQAAVERMDATESEGGQKRIPNHRFQWFLLPAMIFIILSLLTNIAWPLLFRRSAAVLLAFYLLPTTGLDARILPPTAAEKALTEKDYKSAIELFESEAEHAKGERLARLNLGAGTAAYYTKEYDSALKAYSKALLSEDTAVQKAAHFSLGSTLYQQGASLLKNQESPDLEGAIKHMTDALEHYDNTLALQKDHTKAQANREHVEKVIESLKEQQQQQQDQQQNQESENSEEQNEQDQENQEGENQNQDGNNSENSPPDDGENSEEQENQDQDSQSEQNPENNQGNEEQEQQQNQEQNSSQNDQNQQKQPPESQEQQAQNEAQEQQQNQANNRPPPSQNQQQPREGEPMESPEEIARRVLEQNADFQVTPLLNRHLKQPRTDKEW